MTRTRRQILPSGAGESRIDSWQFRKSRREFKMPVCAEGADQSRQIESCVNKDREIDKNRVIQTEGSQANLIGGTLQSFRAPAREADSRCHFKRLVRSTRHWERNEGIPANAEIDPYVRGGLQHIWENTFRSIYRCLAFWHTITTNISFHEADTCTVSLRHKVNYWRMSCHVMSLIMVSAGIWREERTVYSSIVTLKQQVAPVTGGGS